VLLAAGNNAMILKQAGRQDGVRCAGYQQWRFSAHCPQGSLLVAVPVRITWPTQQ